MKPGGGIPGGASIMPGGGISGGGSWPIPGGGPGGGGSFGSSPPSSTVTRWVTREMGTSLTYTAAESLLGLVQV